MTAGRLLVAALLALGLAVSAGVGARASGEARSIATGAVKEIQTGPVKEIQEKELQDFAKAAREVFRIRQAFAPKVQSATSEMDARDMIVEAEKEMSTVIRREGLTVDRYNEILKAAQRDPALAARIQKLVDKAATQ